MNTSGADSMEITIRRLAILFSECSSKSLNPDYGSRRAVSSKVNHSATSSSSSFSMSA